MLPEWLHRSVEKGSDPSLRSAAATLLRGAETVAAQGYGTRAS